MRRPWRLKGAASRSTGTLRRRLPLSGSKKYDSAAPRTIRRRRFGRLTSVAPVEVARAAPEALVLRALLAGPRHVVPRYLGGDCRLLAVHRLLEPRLLLG